MRAKRDVQERLKAGDVVCCKNRLAAYALHRQTPMETRAVTLKTFLLAVAATAALLGAAVVGVPTSDEAAQQILLFGSHAD